MSIDLLPMDVLKAIKLLRSQSGFTWQEIERLSSLPYSPKWHAELGTHGFVDWDELPPAVVKAFPKLRTAALEPAPLVRPKGRAGTKGNPGPGDKRG